MRRHRIPAGQQLGRLAVAGIVGGTLLLTGCGGDVPQASTDLPPAPSTSAEPTPELPPLGPADFPVPDEARVQTEAGAEAFLRYYIGLINHQQEIPGGGPLRALGPDCNECKAIAGRFDAAAKEGLRLEGGQLSIRDRIGTSFREDTVEYSFLVDVSPSTAYDSADDVIPDYQYEAQDGLSSGLGLTWSPERQSWLVVGLTIG